MLRSNALFSRLPRRAPEYLSGTARSTQGHKGCGRDAARRQMGRKPILPSPDKYPTGHKCEERKTWAAIGPLFLWLLSFGGAKESSSPSGASTRLKNCRDSDSSLFVFISQKMYA